jgi:hypothetical protein
MGTWEYRTETVESLPNKTSKTDKSDKNASKAAGLSAKDLTEITSDGWELFAVLPIGTDWIHYVFRRQLAFG